MKLIIIFFFFFLSCESSVDVDKVDKLEPEGDDNRVEILGMVVNNVTQTSFEIVVSYTNDINLNAEGVLYYCNETDSPSCSPIASDQVNTNKTGTKFYVTVSGLSSPYDAGDSLNISFVVTDPDGYLSVTNFDAQFNLAP